MSKPTSSHLRLIDAAHDVDSALSQFWEVFKQYSHSGDEMAEFYELRRCVRVLMERAKCQNS